jgi:hypothetical protein
MSGNKKKCCDGCKKLKVDVILCGDDMLCRVCEVENERELAKLKLDRRTSGVGKFAMADAAGDHMGKPQRLAGSVGSIGDCECGNPSSSTMLTCDICSIVFHPGCAGIPDSAFKHLMPLLTHTGWVCQRCRFESRMLMKNLQAGQVQLAEEVAKLRATVGELQSAFTLPLNGANVSDINRQEIVEQSVRRVVHTELSDKERRSKNVIVSGLAPSDVASDDVLFLELCESNLSTKPLIVRDRCRRLGRVVDGKIQPLLIVLEAADSVAELLKNAPNLRKSNDNVVRDTIFINADMTAAERQLAYENRVLRRARRQSQVQTLSQSAEAFTPGPSSHVTGAIPQSV